MLTELRAANILVIHQGAVGDFILILPALSGLRKSLQPTRMEIMAQPWNLPLVHGRFYADGVFDVNRADMAPFFQEEAPLPESMRRYLSSFDAALIFGRSQTLASNLRRAGIAEVHLLPPFPNERTHLMDHHLSSLAALGIPVSSLPPRIYLREGDSEWAKAFLRGIGYNPDGMTGLAALHPGAGSRKKAWPPHRFADVGRMLARNGTKLLIVQGPADERCVADTLRDLDGSRPVHLRDLSLLQLAAILDHCSLNIGNDSGVSHLAAAVGTPTVTIFGPTDPLVWAPRGERFFWLQSKTSCSPCSPEQRKNCSWQRCLEDISIEDLVQLVVEIDHSLQRVVTSGSWDFRPLGTNHTETYMMH